MSEYQENNDPNTGEPPPFPLRSATKPVSGSAVAGAGASNDVPPPFPPRGARNSSPLPPAAGVGRSDNKPPPYPSAKSVAAAQRPVSAGKFIQSLVDKGKALVSSERTKAAIAKTITTIKRLARGTRHTAEITLLEAKHEARLLRLNSEVNHLRTGLADGVLRAVGAQLLSDAVTIAGAEGLVENFKQLSKAYTLANQALLAGEKKQKGEVARVAKELKGVYIEYGKRALDADEPFPNREQYTDRRHQLEADIAARSAEIEKLQQVGFRTDPKIRREVVIGLMVAGLVLVLTTIAGFRLLSSRSNSQLAGAAMMNSEALVWTLEGEGLKEIQRILKSEDAKTCVARAKSLSPPEQEQQLRALIRSKRSTHSLSAAAELFQTMNQESRKVVEETAARAGIKPEQFILEWLTYEAALDLAMTNRVWSQQGNFKGDGKRIVASFLENVTQPPDLEKGVSVIRKSESHIAINLFGTNVVEDVLPNDAPCAGHSILVRWRSNYNYLRDVLTGHETRELREDAVAVEGGKYLINDVEWFDEFLTKGKDQRWAMLIYEDSPLAIASLARDQQALASVGKSETPITTPSRESLRESFAKLASSVPLVEAVDHGTGSGFLVQHDGKLLVVTNRHVVEGAAKGVSVHFIKGSDRSNENRLTISPASVEVMRVHRNADVAILNVSKAREDIERWGIKPVELQLHDPDVGDHVFAIGHPGAGDSGVILTRTLGDGIVSAVGQVMEKCRFIQVTVPINPGNSGGPLFDDSGKVVGVNTLIIRKNSNRDLALEALNFSLEARYVDELLEDAQASLGSSEIAAVLSPAPMAESSASTASVKNILAQCAQRGFRPYGGSTDTALRVYHVMGHGRQILSMRCFAGETYGVLAVTGDVDDIDLAVANESGDIIAADAEPDNHPFVTFHASGSCNASIVVINPTPSPCTVVVAVFEK